MALPSFLQAMFTPQRSGPGQMAWRDVVNEDSGEFSTGDTQEMYWKRGAAAPGRGQQITKANTIGGEMSPKGYQTPGTPNPNATTGTGQSATQDVMDAIKATGLGGDYDSEGMSSGVDGVAAVMEASAPIGNMSGGWADEGDPGMVSGPLFAPSEPSSLPSDPMFVPSEPTSLLGSPIFAPAESSVENNRTWSTPQDPMGSGVGGVRAADQTFSPPMPEDTITETLIEGIGNPKIHFNVADQVGTFSRSDLRPKTSQAVTDRRADELAFGARADARNMRKQPPGFWDWATGGAFSGPSQYMPSDWNIDIPGQIHSGIEEQIAKHNEEAQVRIDRENMLRKRAMPEYMIRQIMGQHYRGLGPAGAL